MKWFVHFSRQAIDFLHTERKKEEYIFEYVRDAVRKFQGEDVSIDIKKLKGEWKDFYRIRKGKWRIILSFNFDTHSTYIEVIDWRGNIY